MRGRFVCVMIAAAACKGTTPSPSPHDAAAVAVAEPAPKDAAAAPPKDAAAPTVPLVPADPAPAPEAVRIAMDEFYLDETGKRVLDGYDTAGPFSEGRACVVVDHADELIDETGRVLMKGKGFDCDIAYEHGVSTHQGKVIDLDGKVIATPTYQGKKPDELAAFSDGLAAARFGTKWGYIDRTGAVVIPPTWGPDQPWKPGPDDEPGPDGEPMQPSDYYDYARDFHDGMAPVRVGDQWGYIDRTGKMAVSPRFTDLTFQNQFTDGLAMFADASGKLGWIDRTGAIAIPAQFAAATPFAEGVAGVQRGDHWEYIDRTGKTVITLDPSIGYADSFSEGLAMVRTTAPGDNAPHFGFVDHTGKLAIPIRFPTGGTFHHGVATVSVPGPDGNMGPIEVLIDKQGNVLWRER